MLSRLERILLDERLVTREHLEQARHLQRSWKTTLPHALVRGHLVPEEELAQLVARALRLSLISSSALVRADEEALRRVPPEIALSRRVVPVRFSFDGLLLAMSDPTEHQLLHEVSFFAGCHVLPAAARESSIDRALSYLYRKDGPAFHPEPAQGELTKLFATGTADRRGRPAPSEQEAAPVDELERRTTQRMAPALRAPPAGVQTRVDQILDRVERLEAGWRSEREAAPVSRTERSPDERAAEPSADRWRRRATLKGLPPLKAPALHAPHDPPVELSARTTRPIERSALPAREARDGVAVWRPGKRETRHRPATTVPADDGPAGKPSQPVAPSDGPGDASSGPESEPKTARALLAGTVAGAVGLMQSAKNSGEIAEIILDCLTDLAGRAMLFRLKRDVLAAWATRGDGLEQPSVRALWLPATPSSTFGDVVRSRLPYRGPLRFGRVEGIFAAAAGRHSADVVVVPLVHGDRPVGLLYADQLARKEVPLDLLRELTAAAAHHLVRVDRARSQT